MSLFINLIGVKFGRLIPIKRVENDKYNNAKWLCRCDCEIEKIIGGNDLRTGKSQSCGCLKKEKESLVHTKHGHSNKNKRSLTYNTWTGMIQRCCDKNADNYNNYGGRGIKVCKRWLKFENFLTDMCNRPGKGYSIDRINNNKGYYKENCRWISRKENSRNSRKNKLFTYNGKTQCISAWAEEYHIGPKTLWYRLYGLNWPIEKALTFPLRGRPKMLILSIIIWNILDLSLTLLSRQYSNFEEFNPLARYWLDLYGDIGLIFYKIALTIIITTIIKIGHLQDNKKLKSAVIFLYIVWAGWWLIWSIK